MSVLDVDSESDTELDDEYGRNGNNIVSITIMVYIYITYHMYNIKLETSIAL